MSKLSPDDRKQRHEQRVLHNKIVSTFKALGFVYLRTEHNQFNLGGRNMELDAMFCYENVLILSEDTITQKHDHLRTKDDTMQRIRGNLGEFLRIIDGMVEGFKDLHGQYETSRVKVFYIHICGTKDSFSQSEKEEFPNILLWGNMELEYFKWLGECIHYSARFELFRYLGLSKSDIGNVQSTVHSANAQMPIIYPPNYIGPIQGCRVVTFMLSAAELLEMGYVLRKEGWAKQSGLYQRLLDKSKMIRIREYIVKKESSFFNNIIVALPGNAVVMDSNNLTHSIFDHSSGRQDTGLYLSLPSEYNTLGIIDGQHRVYAYHEGGDHDDTVSRLRRDRHLLVTGVMFPNSMDDEERLKLQSQIFLDINQNAKPISPDLLIYIQKLQDPLADTSIAQDVLEYMNDYGVFRNRLQRTTLNSHGIKTASIVKFALKYVVSIGDTNNKKSLIAYWNGDKESLKRNDHAARDEYIAFCAKWLNLFFAGVKEAWKDHWSNDNSTTLLPSVVTINGCLIAYRHQLPSNGLKDSSFFKTKFAKWSKGFSKDSFEFRSSQYGRFAKELLKTVFDIEMN